MHGVFQEAKLAPEKVVAGDSVEFVITLTVGDEYTPKPSRIVYDFPGLLGTSRPSLYFQEDNGYCEVYVSNPEVTYRKRLWNIALGDFVDKENNNRRPMWQRMLVLDLSEGLQRGDTIELHWGETGGGFGPGTKVPIVVPKKNFRNTIHVRYFTQPEKALPDWGRSFTGYHRPVPDCEIALDFTVQPKPLHHWHLWRKPDKALLVPHDLYHNVADVDDVSLWIEGIPNPSRAPSGAFTCENSSVLIKTRKQPLYDTPCMENVFEGMNLYWGDVHTHSKFSVDCIELEKQQMTPADLMVYARDRAGLDFYAVTDHHGPWDEERQKIGKAPWEQTLEAIRAHHREGAFVVFPGFEYRGPRGDTVILFGWLPDYAEIDRHHWKDIRAVWRDLRGKDILTIPHFHNPGKLNPEQWWESAASEVEPVLEIFSCHGSYERADALENAIPLIKSFRPDRTGAHFLAKGYRYGLVCNSDDHEGFVGLNGLTAVFADSLSRESVFEAHRKRHVYGTTNARIRLVFTANGQLMGSVLPSDSHKTFFIEAAGERPLKKIDLFRNAELYRRFVPKGRNFKQELLVRDEEPSNWTVRVTQLDNHIAYSSPIWFD